MSDAAAGPDFRCGFAALVGRPNVGKSTLLNALVGQKLSIVTPRPQTTRHRILGVLSSAQAQIAFVDTPGLHAQAGRALNQAMNRTATAALEGADLAVLVLEAPRWTSEDELALARVVQAQRPAIAAVNKIDRLRDRGRLLPLLAEIGAARDFAAIVPVSAEKGWQLEALVAEVAACLPPGPPLYAADDLTDRDERFLAAEYLREKIFRLLGEEVPYAAAVAIDSFAQEGALRRIHATIVVEKASQRAILLGKDGARMKAIATAARRDMERLFGGKVFLEVWVRVKSGWTDDDRMLTRLGY